MANAIQSNPVYYSTISLNPNDQSTTRTVVLQRRSDHQGFGVYIGEDIPSGLYVVTVERNSPAAETNIQPGDRVLAFNGISVASIQNNPKERLIQVAANSSTLSLTIKSTDIYQNLQVPLMNSATTNTYNQNPTQNVQHYTSKKAIDSKTDLEGYIRSLFGDANIQILQSGSEIDMKPSATSLRQSKTSSKSLPTKHESKKAHRKRHERSKRVTLVNVETQTTNDNDENNFGQYSGRTSSKQNNSSRPNMGVSKIISKNQSSNAISTQKALEKDKPLEFSSISSSSSSERISTLPNIQKQSPSSVNNNTSAANPTMTHMADVVQAAMHASQNRDKLDNRSQIPQKSETDKQTTGTIYTSTAGRDQPQPTGRDQVQPTGRDQVQPSGRDQPKPTGRDQIQPTGRDQPQPTGRDQVQATGRDQVQATGRDQVQPTGRDQVQPTGRGQPPPYTESANNPSTNAGSYNVPKGQVNENTAAAAPISSANATRDLHMVRRADFQGFGFHIQYNKKYYLIQSVEPDSPAAAANLQANDVILYINGDKTDNMPHGTFVQIVNSSQAVDFVVQTASDYLRANPAVARSQTTTTTTASTAAAQAIASQDDDKNKTGLSKALGKFAVR